MKAYFSKHSRQRLFVIVLVLALLYAVPFFTIPGNAAGYIKIDGIDGESTDKGYEKWIEIESIQFGVQRAISRPPTGGDRVVSPPAISDVGIAKIVDISTPKLFTEAVLGTPGKTAEVHLTRRLESGEDVVYAKFTFSDILVSSLSTSGRDLMTESMTLNFEEIKWTYIPYKNGVPGEPVTATYNLSDPK